jgi:ribosomal protein L30/L7E
MKNTNRGVVYQRNKAVKKAINTVAPGDVIWFIRKYLRNLKLEKWDLGNLNQIHQDNDTKS